MQYDSCIFYSNAQLKPKNTWIPIEIVSLSFVKIHVGYEIREQKWKPIKKETTRDLRGSALQAYVHKW